MHRTLPPCASRTCITRLFVRIQAIGVTPGHRHRAGLRLLRFGFLGGWLLCVGSALALDLNAATEAELDGLSGFGPAFTSRVMQARAERPFQNWADFICRVKGVKERTAWRLSRQGARIQQAPYSTAPAQVARD